VALELDREQVQAALATLPDDQRRAIELGYFDGLSQREIAERIGVPLGTVKGRVRLGLQKLYAVLAEPRTAPAHHRRPDSAAALSPTTSSPPPTPETPRFAYRKDDGHGT
jgi:hypothetical protein